ncbi:MAG: septum formation inhibitor Maf [Synergistaceae bacterium]|nr:septum formation inhibitor Maf [Synergistaceae bacterium]
MTRIILASGSPRRKFLLSELGLDFEVYKPEVDETRIDGEAPYALCMRLSRLKAQAGAAKFPGKIIIAADTIVVIDGEILGKPINRDDAFKMLMTLQNREHEVLTGLSVCEGEKLISHVEHTRVKFRPLTGDEIRAYIATGEPDDKAGAYAVQGIGSLLVESLHGDYFNVVGLPVCSLGKILASFGVNLLTR